MKERSLVFFTLLMQSSVGLCFGLQILGSGRFDAVTENPMFFRIGWLLGFLLASSALVSSFFHLKVPLHAWRAISNIKTSWLSREIFFASLYTLSMFIIALFQEMLLFQGFNDAIKWLAFLSGVIMIFCMGSAYRLKMVKFWDSIQTIFAFYTSTLILGLLLCIVLVLIIPGNESNSYSEIFRLGGIIALLLMLNLYFSYTGFLRLNIQTREAFETLKKKLIIRFWIGAIAISFSVILFYSDLGFARWFIWLFILTNIFSEISGRILFYSARVPFGVYLLNE